MTFLNSLKKEIKTKWSARLLVGVLTLVVCSIFASNLVLKREYDLMKSKPKSAFGEYQQVVNQPFKYIKIEGGRTMGQIKFETGEPAVYIRERDADLTKWTENIFIKNDTLFVVFVKDDTNKMNEYPYSGKPFVCISAPNIQSIDVVDTQIYVAKWQQKSMIVNLLKVSNFEIYNTIDNLDFCKISLSNSSSFTINHYKLHKRINIGMMEADLKDSCSLHLGLANIKNFKLNATDGNTIELASGTLKNLMK
jgi:hypothetical protein